MKGECLEQEAGPSRKSGLKSAPSLAPAPAALFASYVRYVAMAICGGILLIHVRRCLHQMFTGETKSILDVKFTGETTFVSLTICPAFETAYKEAVLNSRGTNRGRYGSGGDYSTTSSPPTDPRAFHRAATHRLDELLSSVTVSTASVDRPAVDVPVNSSLAADPALARWTSKPYHLYGECFSLDLAAGLTALGVTDVTVDSRTSVYVFFHHPGQFHEYDSMTKIPSYSGEWIHLDVSYEVTTDSLGADSKYPCDPNADAKTDECVNAEIPLALVGEFGCTVPYLPAVTGETVCDPRNETLRRAAFKRYDTLISYQLRKVCPLPCSTVTAFVGSPVVVDLQKADPTTTGGAARASISFRSTTKVKRTVLAYTWVSMLAEVGQYTGLLLGVSLVNVVNLIDLAAEDAACSLCRKPFSYICFSRRRRRK